MRTRVLSSLSLLALLVPACAATTSSDTESLGITEERALGAVNARWPSPVIPVCWATTSDPKVVNFAGKQLEVQQAVTAAYAPAGVTFTGWTPCPASTVGFDGIVIVEANEQPFSGIGRQQPTTMHLNFTMQNGGPTGARAHCSDTNRIDGCIQTVAVHEFGHALGMLHEEDRSDFAINCGAFGSHRFDDFDVDLGTVDPQSIMNHCNAGILGIPSFQNTLSRTDITAVQLLFGRAPAISSNAPAVSLGSALFPWFFIHMNGSNQLEAAPIEGPLGGDALFNVVPGVNGDPSYVSFQSKLNPAQFLRADAFQPVYLAPVTDAQSRTDESWQIDAKTNVTPGDASFLIKKGDGRAMQVGYQNRVYTTLVSGNPANFGFTPRTQVPERFLRSGGDDLSKPFISGKYLAHVNGQLVMEQVPLASHADGNWELVAGIDNPQLVSIRFTDAFGNQFFVTEQLAKATLQPASVAKQNASRATFTRQRVAATNDEFGRYRFVEELGGNLELCQQPGGVVAMCSVGSALDADSTFFQTLPFGPTVPGVGMNANNVLEDFCATASAACAANDTTKYDSASASCVAAHGTAPPCFVESCAGLQHFCPPYQLADKTCRPGYCLSAMAMCMGGQPCTYTTDL